MAAGEGTGGVVVNGLTYICHRCEGQNRFQREPTERSLGVCSGCLAICAFEGGRMVPPADWMAIELKTFRQAHMQQLFGLQALKTATGAVPELAMKSLNECAEQLGRWQLHRQLNVLRRN